MIICGYDIHTIYVTIDILYICDYVFGYSYTTKPMLNHARECISVCSYTYLPYKLLLIAISIDKYCIDIRTCTMLGGISLLYTGRYK